MNSRQERISEIKTSIDRQRSLIRNLQGKAFWVSTGRKCEKNIVKLENELIQLISE